MFSVYKDRYKNKPIFVIQTGGDEFFMVDDSKFYYDQLPGENYLRYTQVIYNTIRVAPITHLRTCVLEIVHIQDKSHMWK